MKNKTSILSVQDHSTSSLKSRKSEFTKSPHVYPVDSMPSLSPFQDKTLKKKKGKKNERDQKQSPNSIGNESLTLKDRQPTRSRHSKSAATSVEIEVGRERDHLRM